MSRSTVRHAVYNYLSGKSIANVTFYPAASKTYPPPDTATPTNVASFPFIAGQNEKRLGMGKKQITYTVTLELLGFSIQPAAEDGQDDVDALYEAVLDVIRQDPTLGTSGGSNPIFQAGEGNGLGSADLNLRQELPMTSTDETGVHFWAHLDITALEIINA